MTKVATPRMRSLVRKALKALIESTVHATRTFVCPKLCGCELEIEAEWVRKSLTDWFNPSTLSYQHPVPGTIRSVKALHVCAEHRSMQVAAVPFDPYQSPSAGYILAPYRMLMRKAAELTRQLPEMSKAEAADARREIASAVAASKAMHPLWDQSLTTDARLYVHLFKYVANTHTADCGCKTAWVINYFNTSEREQVNHPVQSKQCWRHARESRRLAA